jgi:hypothetical protein
MSQIYLTEEGSTPPIPATGRWKFYAKSNGLFALDDADVEYGPFPGVVTEAEIDFGTTSAAFEGTFTITDANITPSSMIVAVQSGKAATGKDQDENEMDSLILHALAGSGQFTLYALAKPGPVTGKFKINYIH